MWPGMAGSSLQENPDWKMRWRGKGGRGELNGWLNERTEGRLRGGPDGRTKRSG